ncbi:MAG: hypothetical protein ACT4PO_03160 [Actinomycetota bacterium]
MTLGLGLASSHAPSMFSPLGDWEKIYRALIKNTPQPPQAALETPEVLESYIARIKAGFEMLRKVLEAYRPDAVVIVGDDQTEVFSPNFMPQMALFLGDEVAGTVNIGLIGQSIAENHVRLRCYTELARFLIEGLVERGFDIAPMREMKAVARPEGGLGHAFTRPSKALKLADSDTPVVIFFLNAYHPPLPTARRCLELGRAIRELADAGPERIAVYGSGGLSHDPMGPRAGWIDEPLDRWVLDVIARGEPERLAHLFVFDSDTMRGGTGEIRSWIVAAGAMADTRATVVDYIPAHHAVTGLGFAYWQRDGEGAGLG